MAAKSTSVRWSFCAERTRPAIEFSNPVGMPILARIPESNLTSPDVSDVVIEGLLTHLPRLITLARVMGMESPENCREADDSYWAQQRR